MGRVSQDSHPRKSALQKEGRLGANHAVKSTKGTWRIQSQTGTKEKFGKERVHRKELIQKCEPQERERTEEETLHQERRARRVAWDLAKIFTSSRMPGPASGPGCWASCCSFFSAGFFCALLLVFLFFFGPFLVIFWPWVLGVVLLFFLGGLLCALLLVFLFLFGPFLVIF